MIFPSSLFPIFLFLIGLNVGSFLGVVVDRINSKESIIRGRSRCDFCNKSLGFFDLVPLLSYFLLRGKCRYCKEKISLYYPVVELVTGASFVATFTAIFNFQISASTLPHLVYYLLIVACLIVIFFADLKYGIIPNKVIYTGILIATIFIFSCKAGFCSAEQFSMYNFANISFTNYILSGVGAFFVFFILFLVTRGKGMGLGDVKFAFLIGLLVGFPGIVVSLYIAFLTGSIVAFILILWGKKHRRDTMPFGPFLALGTYITLLWGAEVLALVEKFLTLPF